MKKCPTCEKTFDDSMRFCQTDGTPLVADEPVDPYKTMVASKDDIAAAMPKEFTDAAKPDQPGSPQEEVLDLPKESDPKKTMYVSEEELRREMSGDDPGMEIPPKSPEPAKPTPPPVQPAAPKPAAPSSTPTPPEPPKFSQPAAAPPPSPFSSPSAGKGPAADEPGGVAPKTSPPIPSPFSEPRSPEPQAPKFAEPKAPTSSPSNPFDAPPKAESSAPAEWTPPPAPDANWDKQEIGENTPFQPPPAGESVNQIMAIVSLVFGILSICCWISPITGIVAVVTGFLAKKKIKAEPTKYGGGTLALIGMILGAIFFLIGVAYYIFNILVYAGVLGNSLMRGV